MQSITADANAVIASTQAQFNSSEQIPQALVAEKRHVIPFAIDEVALALTPHGAMLAARLRSAAKNRPLIFALGRHVYYKGFDVLAQAMAGVDAQLLIGGSGPLHAALQDHVARLGLNDRVRLTGRIPEEQLAAYFHACDVFCLPSTERAESFGLVQLEAMACGRPVVCTQLHNGVNEVNRDGLSGLTVPPNDPAALALALNRLLADAPLRLRLGEQARERVHRLYSLSTMAAKHESLYGALLDQPIHQGPRDSSLATYRQR